VEFSTVLGSCVATCLFDPVEQVGGMNHFLLAEPPASVSPAISTSITVSI
jgi:chemotaxis protein CheD